MPNTYTRRFALQFFLRKGKLLVYKEAKLHIYPGITPKIKNHDNPYFQINMMVLKNLFFITNK